MKKVLVVVLISVIIMGIYGLFFQSSSIELSQVQLSRAYLMHQNEKLGKQLSPVTLIDDQAQAFTIERLKGQWSLLFFGFTSCPDICISELHLLSKIIQALKKENFHPLPQVYFVSVDPMRDSPAKLKSYVRYFNPDFKAMTGEVDQLHRFMKPFGAYYEFAYDTEGKRVNVEKWENIPADYKNSYTVNHTAWSYLISPQGLLLAAFPTPHDGKLMLQDMKLILRQSSLL